MIMQNSKSFTFQVMWKYFHGLQGKTINMKKRIEKNGKRWIGEQGKNKLHMIPFDCWCEFHQKKNPSSPLNLLYVHGISVRIKLAQRWSIHFHSLGQYRDRKS